MGDPVVLRVGGRGRHEDDNLGRANAFKDVADSAERLGRRDGVEDTDELISLLDCRSDILAKRLGLIV